MQSTATVTRPPGANAAVSTVVVTWAQRIWLLSRLAATVASAASVAGLLAHGLPVAEGAEPPRSVVCVLTGHGLKDPDTALGKAPAVIHCEPDPVAVEKAVFD